MMNLKLGIAAKIGEMGDWRKGYFGYRLLGVDWAAVAEFILRNEGLRSKAGL